MRNRGFGGLALLLVVVVVRVAFRPEPPVAIPVPSPASPAALTGDKAIAHLKANGQYESLGAAITAARYAVRTTMDGTERRSPIRRETSEVSRQAGSDTGAPVPPAATAANPAHGIHSTFTAEGLQLRVRVGEGTNATAFTSDWRLASLGYSDTQITVPAGELRLEGQRAEITHLGPVAAID